MFEPTYIVHWPKLLEALIGLFELPEDESTAADEHFIDVEDTPGIIIKKFTSSSTIRASTCFVCVFYQKISFGVIFMCLQLTLC